MTKPLIPRLNLRPLDPVHSIKAKLAVLVGASVMLTATLVFVGLELLNWRTRYTLSVSVLISLGLSQLLGHGMTSPLRQMTAAATAMAAGRPVPAVRVSARDEVGQLARAFTAMSQELAGADAQRRELLANVAHELRTPVAALRAQLENLVDGVRVVDAVALGELLAQTERLAGLLDDLLDLARAEAGAGATLDRRSVAVAPLAREVAAQVGAARPGPLLVIDVPEQLRAEVDPARLRQLLVNLLDNAARHSAEGGKVEVTATLRGVTLVIEVADDGPGIAPEHRETVFERFRRGHPDPDGGTGLGLAIARWVVSLHGGRIAVVPSAQGCRIRAELPTEAFSQRSSS